MEVKEAKVIKMTPNVKEDDKEVQSKKQPDKLTYEQMVDIANQLQQQNSQLRERVVRLMEDHSVIRMNFLFEVIKNKEVFKGRIYEEAVSEIADALYPKAEEIKEEEAVE